MTVSIIIPLFNTEGYIERTLDSIINQSYNEIEVLVVDDGSSDLGPSIVRKYSEKYKFIKLFNNHRKKGVSGARNTGIEQSKGEYLWFLDSDDIMLHSNVLKERVARMKDLNVDISCSDFLKFYDDNKIIESKGYFESKKDIQSELFNQIKVKGGFLLDKPIHFYLEHACLMWTGTVMVRREFIKAVGFFDESFSHGEDEDMWYRLSLGKKLAYFEEPSVGYRLRDNSLTKNRYKALVCSYEFRKKIYNSKKFSDFKKMSRLRVKKDALSLIYWHREKGEFTKAFRICLDATRYVHFDRVVFMNFLAVLLRKK